MEWIEQFHVTLKKSLQSEFQFQMLKLNVSQSVWKVEEGLELNLN